MRAKLLALGFGLLLVPALSFATPGDLKKLKSAKIPQAKHASCKTCHTKGKELNDFGKSYQEVGKDFSKLTVHEGKHE